MPWKIGTGNTSWPAHAERPHDREQLELRQPPAARRGRVEDVRKHLPDVVKVAVVGVARHRRGAGAR